MVSMEMNTLDLCPLPLAKSLQHLEITNWIYANVPESISVSLAETEQEERKQCQKFMSQLYAAACSCQANA